MLNLVLAVIGKLVNLGGETNGEFAIMEMEELRGWPIVLARG